MEANPLKSSWVRWVLVCLVFLLLGCVLAQVIIPWMATEVAHQYPEVEFLVVPYSALGIAYVLCVELVLVAAWLVVRAAGRGQLFAHRTAQTVNAMRWLAVPMAVLPAVVLGHILFILQFGGPGVVLMLFAAVAVGIALFALLSLGRDVYHHLAGEHAELEAVI